MLDSALKYLWVSYLTHLSEEEGEETSEKATAFLTTHLSNTSNLQMSNSQETGNEQRSSNMLLVRKQSFIILVHLDPTSLSKEMDMALPLCLVKLFKNLKSKE